MTTVLLPVLAAILSPVALFLVSVKKRPDREWFDSSRSSKIWAKISLTSLILGLLLGLLSVFVSTRIGSVPLLASLVISVASASFGYVAAQSSFTDVLDRNVDRNMLRVATLFTLPLAFALAFSAGPVYVYIVVLLVAIAVASFLLKTFMGQSDSRAILLCIPTGFMVLGQNGINLAFVGIMILLLIFGVTSSIKQGGFKGFFTRKISTPLVPIIVVPFALLTPFSAIF